MSNPQGELSPEESAIAKAILTALAFGLFAILVILLELYFEAEAPIVIYGVVVIGVAGVLLRGRKK